MKKTLTYLTIFLVLFSFAFTKVEGQQEILEQYKITAAENNPGLRAKFKQYLAALEDVPQGKALPDPQLAFAYFIMPVETREGPQIAKISLSQMFPWFGSLRAGAESASSRAKAAYETFEDYKSRLYYDVSSVYYELYFLKRSLRITRENIEILASFRDLALAKLETGKVSAVDELRIEMEIADLENRLALLGDRYQARQVAFNNLLNTDASARVIVPDSLWQEEPVIPGKAAWLDSIRINNHQLISLDYEKESLLYREQAARKKGAPNITLGIDYIITGEGPNNSYGGKDALLFPKIGITIPLFRGKYNAMIKQAVLLQESADARKADKTNLLETLVENTWKDYLDAGRRLDLYRAQSQRAHQSIRLLQTAYTTQNRDFEEVLRMQRKVLTYDLELEKARTDLNTVLAFTRYLKGR